MAAGDPPNYQSRDQRNLERAVCVCPWPVDEPDNASYVLSYTGSTLDYIEMTLPDEDGNDVTFRQTLTWTGDNLTAVSAWVQQ